MGQLMALSQVGVAPTCTEAAFLMLGLHVLSTLLHPITKKYVGRDLFVSEGRLCWRKGRRFNLEGTIIGEMALFVTEDRLCWREGHRIS